MSVIFRRWVLSLWDSAFFCPIELHWLSWHCTLTDETLGTYRESHPKVWKGLIPWPSSPLFDPRICRSCSVLIPNKCTVQSHIQMCSWQGSNANIHGSVSCVSAGACVYEGSLHQVGAPALYLPRSWNLRHVSVCNVWVFPHVLFTGDITRLAWLTADAVKCVYVKREVVKSACISGRGCCTSSFVWGREAVSHL